MLRALTVGSGRSEGGTCLKYTELIQNTRILEIQKLPNIPIAFEDTYLMLTGAIPA